MLYTGSKKTLPHLEVRFCGFGDVVPHLHLEADTSKVTIWGESAGAASVGFHLTAFNGRDDKLFRAAVMGQYLKPL